MCIHVQPNKTLDNLVCLLCKCFKIDVFLCKYQKLQLRNDKEIYLCYKYVSITYKCMFI